jgi:hypothetical protein
MAARARNASLRRCWPRRQRSVNGCFLRRSDWTIQVCGQSPWVDEWSGDRGGDGLRQARSTPGYERGAQPEGVGGRAAGPAAKGAQEALGWDLQGWGNAIKRSPPPRKGEPYPAEHYAQVAGAYRAAVAAGQSPRPFIAETWRVSGATVSRWISTARQMNLLGPAPKEVGGRPPHAR